MRLLNIAKGCDNINDKLIPLKSEVMMVVKMTLM